MQQDNVDDVAVEDILAAMRQDGGYLDVAPADILGIYRLAYAHAAKRLLRDVPVRDLMTQTVIVTAPGHTALEAARIMAQTGVSGLPVLSDGALVGVLSLKDLLRLLGLTVEARPADLIVRLLTPTACPAPTASPAGKTPVAALMTAPAITISPETPRSEAARLMTARQINRLPVLEGTRLCGILTRGDVVRSCRTLSGGCPA